MTTRADRQRQRALGKKGGSSTSPAKVAAARRNLALARLVKRCNAATEMTVTTCHPDCDLPRGHGGVCSVGLDSPCYTGCSLAPGHDGPCFVPAGGAK